MAGQMCAGVSEVDQAGPAIQNLVDWVREAAEDKAGQNFEKFVPTLYRSQFVDGMNYFVKVDVGGGKFVHLRVLEKRMQDCILPPPQLDGIQLNKTATDEITYF